MVMRYYIAKINKLLLWAQPPLFERSIIQTKYFPVTDAFFPFQMSTYFIAVHIQRILLSIGSSKFRL